MKNKISFSHNWNNKLDNKIFTTIRGHTAGKAEYYHRSVNHLFDVELNKEVYAEAKLISVSINKLCLLPYHILALDTGLTRLADIQELFRRFKLGWHDQCLLLLFEKK